MGVVVTSALHKSCLSNTSKISDYAIRKVDNEKYMKDARSVGPIQNGSTKRFVPLAMNHLGLRGGHFNVALNEFATNLVTKPSGCSLMKDPFALSMKGALRKILNTWGARLTLTVRRLHAAHALHSMESFYSCASFLSYTDQDFAASGLLPDCRMAGPGRDRLPALDPAPVPVGIACSNILEMGMTEALIRSSFDFGQGNCSRGGVGDTNRGYVDCVLLGG